MGLTIKDEGESMNQTQVVIYLLLFIISFSSSAAEPRVNPLISNPISMRARHDVWNNPNAQRIFFSTYEFEEDIIGLSQVKWAINMAKKGVIVDVVLDSAGHRLSPETILHMTENGVHVHLFGPYLSLKGIKARFRRQRGIKLWARLTSIWRQVTYRMHDKILINFLPEEETRGEVILGGRNARNSHYGLDPRIMRSQRKEQGKKIPIANPAFEYEHEVMVHDRKLHQSVTTYLHDFLESDFTERVDSKKLRSRLEKAQKLSQAMRNQKSPLAQEFMKYDKSFFAFAQDMHRWTGEYNAYYLSKNNSLPMELGRKFTQIISTHASSLGEMMDNGILSGHKLNSILTPIYGEGSAEVFKRIYEDFLYNSNTKIKINDISELLTTLVKSVQTDIVYTLRQKSIKPQYFSEFLGPLAEKGKMQKFTSGIKGIFQQNSFDVDKYKNLDKILNRAEKEFKKNQSLGPHRWKSDSIEVDSVRFLHDTVDSLIFTKKSMHGFYEMLSACRENCVWNSQYGSLTAEAENAIENIIKKNSAIYRFVQYELHRPNQHLSPKKKADMFLGLVQGNIPNIAENLSNPHLPVKEFNKDVRHIGEQFGRLVPRKNGLEEINKLVDQTITKTITPQEYAQKLYNLAKSYRDNIARLIVEYTDWTERTFLNMRGFIDLDPAKLLRPFEVAPFYFMSNDVNSWAVGADKIMHADFHHSILKKFRKMGPGLQVVGFNKGGRIHSKVAVTESALLVSSMNMDPRSEKLNTEVGVLIETKNKGQELGQAFRQHIQSYMKNQRVHIQDGRLTRDPQCFNLVTRILRKVLRPLL